MSVEYDLVVIGSSTAGVYAAIAAARLKARVALVMQNCTVLSASFETQVLGEVGQTLHQLQRARQLGLWYPEAALPSAIAVWEQTKRWSEMAATAIAEPQSPAVLSALGIDVIAGCGEFHRKPKPGFLVDGRSLRSRAYFIALEYLPALAPLPITQAKASVSSSLATIDGLASVGYLTAAGVLQQLSSLTTAQRLVMLGTESIGVELAQALIRLGRSVTLIVSTPHILPNDDAEAAFLIQAQLEAEGVQVVTATTVTQVRQIDGKKWVQAGNQAIEADEIILTTAQPFDQDVLNLKAATVEYEATGIPVNEKLQTTNPHIYACRSHIAGHYTPHTAIADAKIILKNALFLPIAKQDFKQLWGVATDPALASIGHTEATARQRFGNEIMILRQPYKTLPQAQIQGETTGFCKLIVQRNGSILGAHIVGVQAGELIGTIALAMQQNLKIQALADPALPASYAEIISQTAAEWHRLNLQRKTRLQDLLESFFNLRRSGS